MSPWEKVQEKINRPLDRNAEAQYVAEIYNEQPRFIKDGYSKNDFLKDLHKVWDAQKKAEFVLYMDESWPLSQESTDQRLAQNFEWARSEGATNQDILWFARLTPIQKMLLRKTDDLFRLAHEIFYRQNGLTPDGAMEKIKRDFPIYIDGRPDMEKCPPSLHPYFQGENRPLPYELHNRIDRYIINNASETGRLEIARYSSFNAWVRSKIAAGLI